MPDATCLQVGVDRVACGQGDVDLPVRVLVSNNTDTRFRVGFEVRVGPAGGSLTPVFAGEQGVDPTDRALEWVTVPLGDPETNRLLPCPGVFDVDVRVTREDPIGTFAPVGRRARDPSRALASR